MTALKDKIILLILRLSWMLRRNPARFLFNDRAFRAIASRYETAEAELLNRRWVPEGEGVIWEVGASLGKFTGQIARANPNCKVYAFEPNFNSLYFLAYRTAHLPNVEIVPAPLTVDGRDMRGTHDPNFGAPATGPLMPTFSLPEALAKFGKPAFIKMDIEGEEFGIFRQHGDLLRGVRLLVEWHTAYVNEPIPALEHWRRVDIARNHTYLEPLPDK